MRDFKEFAEYDEFNEQEKQTKEVDAQAEIAKFLDMLFSIDIESVENKDWLFQNLVNAEQNFKFFHDIGDVDELPDFEEDLKTEDLPQKIKSKQPLNVDAELLDLQREKTAESLKNVVVEHLSEQEKSLFVERLRAETQEVRMSSWNWKDEDIDDLPDGLEDVEENAEKML